MQEMVLGWIGRARFTRVDRSAVPKPRHAPRVHLVASRFSHSLLAWTCLLLLGAASFLRPGMVLCISEHGHVRIEANCASTCETLCAEACEQPPHSIANASGTGNDCRDVPLELEPTSLTRADSSMVGLAANADIPSAILDVPFVFTLSCSSAWRTDDSIPRPPAELGRLRAIVLQV